MRESQKSVYVATVVAVLGVACVAWWMHAEYKRKNEPCRYLSYEDLIASYPTLKEIWNRKMAYLAERGAAEKIQSARVELAVKRGAIDEMRAFELEQRMWDQTMKGEEEFETRFRVECQRITGKL